LDKLTQPTSELLRCRLTVLSQLWVRLMPLQPPLIHQLQQEIWQDLRLTLQIPGIEQVWD
ncbi:MAG: hypothetical protein ACK56F_29990, partial [bacterium]